MGINIFQKKSSSNPLENRTFSSRSEAFSVMLKYLIEDKEMEPMEAVKQANEFAEIFAKNMGIPDKVEPELKGVDKYISMAEKIGNYLEQHPKVIEYSIPALTFLVGLVTGKKAEQYDTNNHQTDDKINPQGNKPDPIDWDKVD